VAPWTVPYAWQAYANDARGRFFDSVISTRVRVLPCARGHVNLPKDGDIAGRAMSMSL
jgi:hypothetical protein